MKKLSVWAGLLAFVVSAPVASRSVEPTVPGTPLVAPAAIVTPETKPARPLPYQGVVSRVDGPGRTFTVTTKAGKDHLFTITDKTQILKDDAPAKFEDIKTAGVVRGSRLKLGENKWEALKVIIGAKVKAS